MPRKAKIDTRPLVDEFIKVKRERAAAEKQYNELRAKILALGLNICKGTAESVVLLERTRNTLDSETLKADYGTAWYLSYCKETNYYELEIFNG